MKAKEFEKKFDAGEDITKHLDLTKAKRPGHEQKRVNVDFPMWMIESLDREAFPPWCAASIADQDADCPPLRQGVVSKPPGAFDIVGL